MPILPSPLSRSAHIEGEYRWVLRREWSAGPSIAWVGLNPSTADGTIDDPTILREVKFSHAWGFGSLIKLNIYPFRSSSPKILQSWLNRRNLDTSVNEAIEKNYNSAFQILCDVHLRVAAWGLGGDIADIESFFVAAQNLPWHCVGINSNGSPKHTLARGRHRVPNNQMPIPWKSN